MSDEPRKPYEDLLKENEDLLVRFEEASEVLTAIRTGTVDALVVEGPKGEQVYSLQGADHPYRIFVEHMNEGAVTIDENGVIVYANRLFAKLVGLSLELTVGRELASFLSPDERLLWDELIRGANGEPSRWELTLLSASGESIPILLSARHLPIEPGRFYCCIVSDLREQRLQERLKQSEERFRAFTNVANDVVYRMSPDWSEMRYLQGRKFIADTLEPSRTWLDTYIHPDDQRHVMETIQRAVRSNSVFELEHRVIRVDGSLGWTHSRAIPILDDRGEIVEWFGAASNVTQRKQAEEALQQRHRQLELLAMTSQRLLLGRESEQELLAPIFEDIARLIDMEMFYHYRPSENPKMLRLHASGGITEKERDLFATMGFGELLCGQVAERRERLIIEDLQHSSHPGIDVLRAMGATSYAGFPLVANGALVGTIAFISNRRTHLCEDNVRMIQTICDQIAATLERMKLQRELREREERLTLAVNVGRMGLWDWDVLTGRVEWSAGHFELLGLRPGDVQPSYGTWASHVHPDDRPDVEQNLQESMASRAEYRADFRVIWADGSIHWMAGRGRFQYTVDGRCSRMVGVMVDITHRKEAEAALREREERAREFAAQLEGLVAERTTELLQSQDRLRALAMELNLAEQRERKRLATELHDYLAQLLAVGKMYLDRIKQEAGAPLLEELGETLDQALTYTRTLVAQLSPPFFHELGLAYAFKWLADQLESRGLRVSVDVEDGRSSVTDDHATLLFQAARELLMNVVKHAGSNRAHLAMTTTERTLRIEVSDDGSGFDVAAIDSASATGTQGRFGLFSIRERMIAMGGHFDLVSRPGDGTRATLVVPLNNSAAARIEDAGLRTGLSGLSSAHGTHDSQFHEGLPIRVLLVDDHAMVRQGLRSILDAYADVKVVGEAATGDEAVALTDQLRPSVIVMDINMPRMNGIEATAAIKARHSTAVVIGLSVQADEFARSEMLRAGATALMTKEAAVEELYRAIQEALHRKVISGH
ncbi:MAG: PAS domain-containing protein [Nitrospira sp.]|nr:PAS domain-containing protein [Nitrospira sp.]